MKKVKRTWTNKKTGETVTKEYTYKKGKTRKGYVLVDSQGRLREENIKKYKQMIDSNDSYTEAEKRNFKKDLDTYINTRRRKTRKDLEAIDKNTNYTAEEKEQFKAKIKETMVKQRGKEFRPLTTVGYEGHLQENKIERMFANAGLSSSEVAKDMGIDEEDILNPDNWQDGLLVINGVKYAFNHNYTGDALEVVE